MSDIVDKSFGGLLQNLFGGSGHLQSHGLKHISFGLVAFVDNLHKYLQKSEQDLEKFLEEQAKLWKETLKTPGVKATTIAAVLSMVLIATTYGFNISDFLIYAVKLCQDPYIGHKKIGYIIVSQDINPESDLCFLLINTIYRDLSSGNLLFLQASLHCLPYVCVSGNSPSYISNIIPLLSHEKAYIRRKSAVVIGYIVSVYSQSWEDYLINLVPLLLHLMTDTDPSTASSALVSLAKIYQICYVKPVFVRDQVACGAAHLLRQALFGSLPVSYNANKVNAPFIQIQMLRVLSQVASTEWNVPIDVVDIVGEVLTQPWGVKEYSLYAALSECIVLIGKMPRSDLHYAKSLQIISGFLKSTCVDLMYVGLSTLSKVVDVFKDILSPEHLQMIIACLQHTDVSVQMMALQLLSRIANPENYKTVCETVMEFSSKITECYSSQMLHGHLYKIIGSLCEDIPWCIRLLMPLIISDSCDSDLVKSYQSTVFRVLLLYDHSGCSDELGSLFVSLLSELCDVRLPSPAQYLIGYFTLYVLLHLNRDFVSCDLCKSFLVWSCHDCDMLSDPIVTDSLINIYLLHPELKNFSFLGNNYLSYSMSSKLMKNEVNCWLSNPCICASVYRTQNFFCINDSDMDLSLSFLDEYIVSCLEYDAYSEERKLSLISPILSCSEKDDHSDTASIGLTNLSFGSEDAGVSSDTYNISAKDYLFTSQSPKPVDWTWCLDGRVRIPVNEPEEKWDSKLEKNLVPVDVSDGNDATADDADIELACEAQENIQNSNLIYRLMSGLNTSQK